MSDLCVQPHTLVNSGYMLSLQVKFYTLKCIKHGNVRLAQDVKHWMQINCNSFQSPFLEICCIIKSFPLEWKLQSFHFVADLYFALNNLVYTVWLQTWLQFFLYSCLKFCCWNGFVRKQNKTKQTNHQTPTTATKSEHYSITRCFLFTELDHNQ